MWGQLRIFIWFFVGGLIFASVIAGLAVVTHGEITLTSALDEYLASMTGSYADNWAVQIISDMVSALVVYAALVPVAYVIIVVVRRTFRWLNRVEE